MTFYLIVFVVGLVGLVIFAVDRHLCLTGLENDLSKYLEDCKQVVEIADDPRVIIHYKATVSALSTIYNTYFTRKHK